MAAKAIVADVATATAVEAVCIKGRRGTVLRGVGCLLSGHSDDVLTAMKETVAKLC